MMAKFGRGSKHSDILVQESLTLKFRYHSQRPLGNYWVHLLARFFQAVQFGLRIFIGRRVWLV